MEKLLFDPITYQFYFSLGTKCPKEAREAGFVWDPARRRLYTESPKVAAKFGDQADAYVLELLRDVLVPNFDAYRLIARANVSDLNRRSASESTVTT